MSFFTNQTAGALSRDDWQSPPEFVELVRKVGPIALDPCTTLANPTGARSICVPRAMFNAATIEQLNQLGGAVHPDGLATNWITAAGLQLGEQGLVYVNFPYGKQAGEWTARCAAGGLEVIALAPARTDTQWFQRDCAVGKAQAVCFWAGRLQFVGAPDPAKFPSAVSYWGPRKYRFADVFAAHGRIWI